MRYSLVLASFVAVAAATSKLGVRTPAIRNGIQARSLYGRQSCPSGYIECGDNCAPIGTECCDWGSYCKVGTFCDKPGPGESGEPGCCPDGEDCTTGGGTNTKTLTFESPSTNTNTIEESTPTVSIPYKTPTSTYVVETPTYSATKTTVYLTPTDESAQSVPTQPSFTGAAVKDAVPVAVMGVAAIAGLFGLPF